MRLLIKLVSTKSIPYEMEYHYHLQGFIYNLLKDSKYDYIHNMGGYKFFCFSNIFPAKSLEQNDQRTLIISSPDVEFITHIYNKIRQTIGTETSINIGSMQFRITIIDKLDIIIPSGSPFSLITGTPIIIRIPQEKYRLYGVEPKKKYNYIFWRTQYPIQLFVSQVQNNLIKKYNEYYQKKTKDIPSKEEYPNVDLSTANQSILFEKFRFKKQISTKLSLHDSKQTIIGTTWEFEFEGWEDKELIKFALDVGLGERNSLGFGFMNIKQ